MDTIAALIEDLARRYPGRTAAADIGRSLDFATLDRRTSALAASLLQADDFTTAEATRDGYGFGYFLFSLADGTPVAWHDGIGFGTRTIFFLLPESDDGLVILTNKATGNRIFRDIVCAWDRWLHAEQTKLCQSY